MYSIEDFYSPERFSREGKEILERIARYLKDILSEKSDTPVLPILDPDELFTKYERLLQEKPGLIEFTDTLLKDSNHLHSPGYTGHQCAVPNPFTALSSLIGSLLNNGSAVYEMGPANVAMERVVSRLFANELGFPMHAEGLFTSGGSLANLTALLAARQNQTPYDIWEEGIREGDRPVYMVPVSSHYSLGKAINIMGLGTKAIIPLEVDENYRIRTDLVEKTYRKAISEGKRVIAMVANACSTATGSYDDLETLGKFCQDHHIWLHVDGAHGGPAILSEKYKHLLNGIEKADSVIIDFHKMLMTPGLNTLVLFREGEKSYSTFAQKASYLLDDKIERDWYNYAKRTMECTKSMMGLNVYIQLLLGGKSFFASQVDKLYDLGKEFAEMCKNKKNIELAINPDANIVCFRYNDGQNNLNLLNREIRKKIIEEGSFYIVQAELQKKIWLRVSLMNSLTTTEMLKKLLDKILDFGKQIREDESKEK